MLKNFIFHSPDKCRSDCDLGDCTNCKNKERKKITLNDIKFSTLI